MAEGANPNNQITTMITVIASAVVTPFMMAAPADNAAALPEAPVAVYNWSTQNAQSVSDEDFSVGANGSFCLVPGGGGMQTVDDWNMC